MSVEALKSQVLPLLLSGVRGGAVPKIVGIETDLHALALTAQALRFDRPARPEHFLIDEAVIEARRVVDDATREMIVRLLTEDRLHSGFDVLKSALAKALAANRARLHPFDLPRLESFVEAHADDLGAEALAYSQRNVVADRRKSYFAPEATSDETWMLGNRGEKARYIARRRGEDPAVARLLVEEVWASQDVESRVRIAGSLRVGATSDDKEFLTSLMKDRSPRVRDVIRGILVRLPDYVGEDGHLKSVKSRIRVKDYGVPMMRRTEMRIDLPSNVGYYGASSWIQENFGKISLAEFAASYEMSVDEVIKAASCDDNMIFGVLVMAVCSGAAAVVGQLVGVVLHDEGSKFISIDPSIYEHLPQDELMAISAAVLRPETWSYISVQMVERLHGLLDGAMTEDMMRRVLSSRGWRSMVADTSRMSVDVIDYLAVMCPRPAREHFLAQLAPLDANWTAKAVLYLQTINNLESSNV